MSTRREKGAAMLSFKRVSVLAIGILVLATRPAVAVEACKSDRETLKVHVNLVLPSDRDVAGVSVSLSYRADRMSLPGSGADVRVRERVTDTPEGAVVAVYDTDRSLRLVVSRAKPPLASGRLLGVSFDRCGEEAMASDFQCAVEGCATIYGNVEDCRCDVAPTN